MINAAHQSQITPDAVLAKALLNAAREAGVKQGELAEIIGVSATQISRIKKERHLNPESKSGELALLFIRICRALHALSGGDRDWIRHFLRTRNSIIAGIPLEQMQSVQGLVNVLTFVDAIRGKN